MSKYFENLDKQTKQYFRILSPEIPNFLEEYLEVPEMKRLSKISQACGTDYTKLYNHTSFYNILDHSVGCALIVWNFTKDKKQTLSALFHDISTPVFKHCIDFLNGDYEKQESTEDLTSEIIKNSKEIMKLLKRDNIKLEEVNNYHIYPIADNDSPKLSSDRLEYTLQNGMKMNYGITFSIDDIKEIYKNIELQKDEEGIDEIGFKDEKIAEKFINMASVLWPNWCNNRYKLTAQFYADIIKKMVEKNWLTKEDLYKYSESEVIDKIKKCEDKNISDCFKKFQNTTKFFESDEKPSGNNYWISLNCKKRYINPLVNVNGKYKRIKDISEIANQKIEEFLNWNTKKYAYFDFNF